MATPALDMILARSSPPIQELRGEAPSDEEISTLITAAARVPDHGRLAPWRFILYRGDARIEIGKRLAELAEQREGPLPEGRRNQELTRFSRAPLVIGVVFVPRENAKIPEWEMQLSAGAAAMNLTLAATALGYRTNWVTNWYSYDEEGRRLLGLEAQERVAGFIHIGRFEGAVPERPRPDIDTVCSEYRGPA